MQFVGISFLGRIALFAGGCGQEILVAELQALVFAEAIQARFLQTV